MIEARIREEYFEWMCGKVCQFKSIRGNEFYDRFADGVSFRKLLSYLHDVEFTWEYPMDRNRSDDGISLRDRFTYELNYEPYILDYIDGPCSVLEMMIALAIHTEEDIMDDMRVGDRTGQWFWCMVVSLGLGGMNDRNFDKRTAEDTVARFLNHEYEPNGRGGLFTIRNCAYDLRDEEIHVQRNMYLNSII